MMNNYISRISRKDGIPAYVFVPLESDPGDDDDSSIDSLSSLEGFKFLEDEDRKKDANQSTKLRAQSLPTTLSFAYKGLSMNSDSALAPVIDTDHITDEDHMDRPPKVPQRRRSIQIQASLSCPKLVTPYSKKDKPARQALAA